MAETIGKYLLCMLGGYLLGGLSPAYLIGRFRGYDVRRSGSRNAGASNTVLLAGKRAGFVVAVLDILKSACAWWAAAAIFPELPAIGQATAVAALLGHMYSPYLHFHGGKGLACLGGIALAYSPRALLILLGVALLIGVLTNYVCVTTVSMSVVVPLYYGLTSAFWLGAAVLAVPILPIFIKHLENFRRIRSGQELRLSYLLHKDEELKRIGHEGN